MYVCQRDLSQECKGVYRDCTDCVLDKIRAEIMSLTNGDTPERIWNVDALEILDKYKAESETRT